MAKEMFSNIIKRTSKYTKILQNQIAFEIQITSCTTVIRMSPLTTNDRKYLPQQCCIKTDRRPHFSQQM